MVKVFTTNSNGKIEFTKDELEKVLNEVWQDGHNSASSYWWSSPTTTPYYAYKASPTATPYYSDKTVEITCGLEK